MSGPITPDEAAKKAVTIIPDTVFDVWNALIVAAYRNGRATVLLKDAVAALKAAGFEDPIRSRYCDIEDLYRAKGWKVKYDHPGWDESYDPFFVFSKG